MLDALWAWLTVEANRAVLGWIGTGLVVVAGGIWAVIRFFAGGRDKPESPPPRPSVRASGGSVAVGGDSTDSPVNIGAPPVPKPKGKGG